MDILVIVLALLTVVFLIILANLRIVPQSKAYVMERLGVYSRTWYTGMHIKIPFFERAAKIVDLREQVVDFPSQVKTPHPAATTRNNLKNISLTTKNASLEGGLVNAGIPNLGAITNASAGITGDANANASTTSAKLSKDYKEYFEYYTKDNSSQSVITKDNVRIEIDTVVFYQITDPKLYAYGHANPMLAIEHLTATTIRNIVGELELDETLTSREVINKKMRVVLDEATDAWGIKVNRVEVKNIIIEDPDMREAMEKQMIAERTRRATVIAAEGDRKAAILQAEGQKQSEILRAEGEKQAKILAAEALREAMICEAEGQAEAILQVQQATAEGINMLNNAEPGSALKVYLGVKSLEAFEKAADGQATKIIIPSEIQGLAGLATTASEVFKAE